ncbi:tripartite tricarboxylate transporter substrate binding protein [Roseicella sp. DB1501]|uniref:Bug family tripartite tricarboxylate transporter substrate binding protein n=1 Tax=Roseicella sp. DB1501 TaxID=2730925 RepID=UPI001491FDEB|nr:tripartite tricarboxylate transporter substrate-binding protein [Roseicella sp. DB1501]NOG71269.1 tripartite tricarboxylate transporter substrate binding protein [Roseicella sp. DB1501]
MHRRPLLAGLLVPSLARADGWQPDRPLRLVVPFPPGGPTDLVARPLAQRLGEALGRPVVVDNRGGAGGNLGAEAVARATPDGITLLLSNVGVLAVNTTLYRSLPFDPVGDFVPIALIAGAPVALVVRADLPTPTLRDFVAWTRSTPQPVPYGSAGAGSPGHLVGEVFRSVAGAALVHVPYRGSAPALQDLLAGNIPAVFDPVQSPLAQVQAGRLRALAVAAAARSSALPEVPTMAEVGVAGIEMTAWWAVVAPAATPAPVITRLADEFARIDASPGWRYDLGRQGITPMYRGPSEMPAFLSEERRRWGAAVRASGAVLE